MAKGKGTQNNAKRSEGGFAIPRGGDVSWGDGAGSPLRKSSTVKSMVGDYGMKNTHTLNDGQNMPKNETHIERKVEREERLSENGISLKSNNLLERLDAHLLNSEGIGKKALMGDLSTRIKDLNNELNIANTKLTEAGKLTEKLADNGYSDFGLFFQANECAMKVNQIKHEISYIELRTAKIGLDESLALIKQSIQDTNIDEDTRKDIQESINKLEAAIDNVNTDQTSLTDTGEQIQQNERSIKEFTALGNILVEVHNTLGTSLSSNKSNAVDPKATENKMSEILQQDPSIVKEMNQSKSGPPVGTANGQTVKSDPSPESETSAEGIITQI